MNDRELLYIKTIADTKSISKAAEELFIAQPSLSQALQKIEAELGTALFIREPRGMKLTFAGEKYYLMAKEILNIYHDFKTEITHINELKSGRVVIGVARFMGMNVLPKVLPTLNKRYPNVEIKIIEESSQSLEHLVLSGDIDFALTHAHTKDMNPKIDYDVLDKEYFVLVSEKGYLKDSPFVIEEDGKKYVDLTNLQDEKYILLEHKKGIRKVQDKIFDSYGFNPNIVLTTKNFETAKRLAANGMGLTLTPRSYLDFIKSKDYDTYELLGTVENSWLLTILTMPNIYKSQASQVFINEIKKHFARDFDETE